MNHMAAIGSLQRAPEIVIVNDGKPVENVGASGTGAKVARIAIPAVVALGLGLGIGRLSKDANFYNEGLKDAKALLGDAKSPSTIVATKKLVADVERTLDEMNTKTKLHPDAGFDKQLTELATKLGEVKEVLVFRAKQNALDPEISAQILAFYAGVAEIKGMLDTHTKASKGDDQLMQAGKAKGDGASIKEGEVAVLAGQPRYAIYISAPSTDKDAKDVDKGAEFGAKLVEVGSVFCGGKEAKGGKCPEGEQISGFGYRGELDGLFVQGDLATQGADNVPAKKLIPLLANGMRDGLLKGNEAGASEFYYVRRLQEISKRTKKLIEDANKLEQKLQTEANKGSRFSFFL
ncbi:MAG: hypothetical protein NT062_36675 [Proteobacteria bacterium]|nr:hypothetical protein [Pseudomonadota bacterium]